MRLIPTRLQRHPQPDRHHMVAPFAAARSALRYLCRGALDRGSPLLETA